MRGDVAAPAVGRRRLRLSLRHTACGDVQRAASTLLTAYYTEAGYPPGRWLGLGLAGSTTGEA